MIREELEIGLRRIAAIQALYYKICNLRHSEKCDLLSVTYGAVCRCGLSEVREMAFDLFDETGGSGE